MLFGDRKQKLNFQIKIIWYVDERIVEENRQHISLSKDVRDSATLVILFTKISNQHA